MRAPRQVMRDSDEGEVHRREVAARDAGLGLAEVGREGPAGGAEDEEAAGAALEAHRLAGEAGERAHRVADRPGAVAGAERDRAGGHGRGEARDAGARGLGHRADGPGGGEAALLARVVGRHRDALEVGVGRGGAAVGVGAHRDRDEPEVERTVAGERAGAGEDGGECLEGLADGAIVGGMDDCRGAEGREVDRRRVGRAAVELGEVGEDATADLGAGKSGAGRGEEVGRAGRGPGALGLMAGEIAAGEGDDAARAEPLGGAAGGDGGDLFGGVGDDLESDGGVDGPGEVGLGGVDAEKEAGRAEIREPGGRGAIGEGGLVGEEDRGDPHLGGGAGRDRRTFGGAGESDAQALATVSPAASGKGRGRERGRQ